MFLESIIGASLIMAASQAREIPNISIPLESLFSPDRRLVKAHALEDAPLGPVKAVPFEIDHVYVGPAGLKGQKFTATFFESTILNMPMGTGMPVVNGESAICWISTKAERDGGVSTAILRDYPKGADAKGEVAKWLAAYPYQKKLAYRNFERGDVEYEMAAARADVSEKVYRAGGNERFNVIDGFARSGDSVKAAAALQLLLSVNTRKPAAPPAKHTEIVKNPKIADYVLPLVKPGAARPRVQGVVDQLLYLNKDGWRESPERWKMYEGWFAGDWKEKKDVPWDASEERVLVAFARPGRPYPQMRYLQLWLAGLTNPARSDRFKAEFIRQVEGSGRLGDTEETAREAFDELTRTVGTDPTPARRVAAAKLLVAFIPFSAEQRTTLEAIRKQKLGDEVSKEITKALAEK
jgi:hypothetical protein